jgi:hypothetical protein
LYLLTTLLTYYTNPVYAPHSPPVRIAPVRERERERDTNPHMLPIRPPDDSAPRIVYLLPPTEYDEPRYDMSVSSSAASVRHTHTHAHAHVPMQNSQHVRGGREREGVYGYSHPPTHPHTQQGEMQRERGGYRDERGPLQPPTHAVAQHTGSEYGYNASQMTRSTHPQPHTHTHRQQRMGGGSGYDRAPDTHTHNAHSRGSADVYDRAPDTYTPGANVYERASEPLLPESPDHEEPLEPGQLVIPGMGRGG